MTDEPLKFEEDIANVSKKYFLTPIGQAVDDGVTPPVLVEILLRCAYATLDSAAQENRHNLPWAFRKLADNVAERFEEQER